MDIDDPDSYTADDMELARTTGALIGWFAGAVFASSCIGIWIWIATRIN